jgi:HSP20 family protein
MIFINIRSFKMTYVKLDPFRGFESVAKKMSQLVDDFDKGFNIEYGDFAPKIDIAEDEKKIYLYAEIPGVDKKDVKVTINDENTLLIKGKKLRNDVVSEKADNEDAKEEISFIRAERRFGEFSRSFVLPDNINSESIKASFKDGILSIELDKKEPEKPKEKEINID